MNKRSIAFILVLLIAVGGVFAATNEDSVTATLIGILGPYFKHGFTTSAGDYQAGITIGEDDDDVFEKGFGSFTYKFKTNMSNSFVITMNVGDFLSDSYVVKIAQVFFGSTSKTSSTGEYEIASFKGSGTKTGSETIKIYPATAYGATVLDHKGEAIVEGQETNSAGSGTYTSTITISVTTDGA